MHKEGINDPMSSRDSHSVDVLEGSSTAITQKPLRFAEWSQEEIDAIVQSVPGGERNVQDIYALSSAQQGILSQMRLVPEVATYVMSTTFELDSYQDLQSLVRSVNEIIGKHDCLRSEVLWENLRQPVQVIYRNASVPLQEIAFESDVDCLNHIEQEMSASRRPPNIDHVRPVQLMIASDARGTKRYALLRSHQLFCDKMSFDALVSEILARLHRDEEYLGASTVLRNYPEATIPTANEKVEKYFRAKIGHLIEPSAPFGVLWDGRTVFGREQTSRTLQPTLGQHIRAQALRTGVSAEALFHAALSLVIARTTGHNHAAYGAIVSSENGPAADGAWMRAMSINTLPLCFTLAGKTADAFVKEIHRNLCEIASLVRISLSKTQLYPNADGNLPLFTTILNYRQTSSDSTDRAAPKQVFGVRVRDVGEAWSNFPITILIDDMPDTLRLTAQTDQRINPERILEYMETAVQAITMALSKSPDSPILDMPVLSYDERYRLTELFSKTRKEFPEGSGIHRLFEDQVAKTPSATAVVFERCSLSYAELNHRANKLARYLRSCGAGPDRLVAVCVERGIDLVIALLGTLKSGAAYVPLDPSYPADRLAYMLGESAPVVLLTQQQLRGRLPEMATDTVDIDKEIDTISEFEDSNLEDDGCEATPQSLAYVIYTSGSTGNPKGVMIEHRAVVNFLCSMQAEPGISASDCVLAVTTISFDIAALEIFLPLVSGAKLVMVSRNVATDATRLIQSISEVGATILQATPATWRLLLQGGWSGCENMKALCGGEALTSDLSSKLLQRVGALWNLYGPTETTIWSCGRRVNSVEADVSVEAIGSPIANTQVYILDGELREAPIGVVGEIYIGGTGVARGYLRNPDRTAERFLPDPFGKKAGARIYKTGDLGKWTSGGVIEYLGRNDHQVKIRGFRIELGEIEARLAGHPGVQQAAVIAREDAPEERRLVAYVVPSGCAGPTAVTAESLRTHLIGHLPDYMVPSAFVLLDKMPLTPNGKLDRRALPAPDVTAYIARPYEAPQDDVEEILAGVWQALLGVARVGRHDNFFELGGHSLLIVKMLDRLRRFGLSVDARQVFELATLAELASALRRDSVVDLQVPPNQIPLGCETIGPHMLSLVELDETQIESIAHSVPGGARNIQDIYPLATLQEGILFHHLLAERGKDPYVFTMVLSLSTKKIARDFRYALQRVVDRHDALRTLVRWEGLSRSVQIVLRQAELVVDEIELASGEALTDQIDQWIRAEHRMDLTHAPLIGLHLASEPTGERHYALLKLHHIIADATSLGIILSEIQKILEGQAEIIPGAPYRDHVARTLEYARAGECEEFFRHKLGSVREPTAPFGILDIRDAPEQIRDSRLRFNADMARRIRAQARRVSVSAATLFHAAWALVVAHTSGRRVVVLGTVLSGRLYGEAEVSRTVGVFINTLPLRLDLRNLTAAELVERTQRELVELLTHERASLAAAQSCSAIEGSAPLFTTLLNYRHATAGIFAHSSDSSHVRVLSISERTNYPITLSVDDLEEEFELTAITAKGIDADRISAYVEKAMESLVDALERGSEQAAFDLSILRDSERDLIVRSFNRTDTVLSSKAIHELFEEQVKKTPHATAVVFNGQSHSYANLNTEANRLARYLIERGLRPGEFVPIVMQRSPKMLATQLAVLKAGAAYVPLDPSSPAERLAFMIADCSAVRILADHLPQVQDPIKLTQWIDCTTLEASALEAYPRNDLESFSDPVAPAYAMYTSGSTGRPKGVIVPHVAVSRLVINNGYARIEAEDAVAHYSNPAFDASTFEIWAALLNGARVVIVPQSIVLEPALFLETLTQNRVTVLWISVGLFNRYADTLGNAFRELKYLIVGGDSLDAGIVQRVLLRDRPKNFLNGYGPTECTTFSTTYHVRSIEEGSTTVPIGGPISNVRLYVLNAELQPVPIGASGEIYIGGAGLALGYLNRPTLTAERFVADPYSVIPGSRLYRTGDLGRWRVDGAIEFVGRSDRQVKIRGFRIELGEIEAQLAARAGVKEAAVIVREEPNGDKRLIAYVVPVHPSGDRCHLDLDDLRAHLKSTLPEYMMPSAFVVLQQLPLTENGKLDRRALPAHTVPESIGGEHEQPEGNIELGIAAIWCESLCLERVGRNDSFFDIGGHSLDAVKVVSKVNQVFGTAVSVKNLYESQTLQSFASRVRGEEIKTDFVDLSREAQLDPSIVVKPSTLATSEETVILTGATGFVGRFLLAQLLKDTDATVYCLVRATSTQDAMSRLKNTLLKWDLWNEAHAKRIRAISGDVKAPRLGLTQDSYARLAERVGNIFHCATSMNHLESYATARATNVDGAREIVRFSASGRQKRLNYISTLSVFSDRDDDAIRRVDEESSIDHERHLASNGYASSKWVGEKIFAIAADRGIPCNIFRLGLVWADSQRGRYDELQREYRLFKSCLLAGVGISDYRCASPPTPVDYVARAVLYLSAQHREGKRVFHISSAEPMREGLFERCKEAGGLALDLLPADEWASKIRLFSKEGLDLPVTPLLQDVLLAATHSMRVANGVARSLLEFDVSRTRNELERAGIRMPELSDASLCAFVDWVLHRDAPANVCFSFERSERTGMVQRIHGSPAGARDHYATGGTAYES